MLGESSTACVEGMRRHKQNRNKYEALNVKAIDYLKTFGQSKNNCHIEAKKAESYLVKALRPSSVCTTMNELRNESYLDKSSSLIELPPTSSSIFGHILQSHFIIDQYLNLMNATEKSNVQEFDWIEAEDVLYQTNAYHQYFATCCQIWMQGVPDVASVSLQI